MDAAVSTLSTPTNASKSTTMVKLSSGSHDFKIIGYSSFNGIGYKWIKSQTFTVGGHRWCIRYFPNGIKDSEGHVSIFLESIDTSCNVNALFDIRFVDPVSGDACADTPEVVGPIQFDAPSDTVAMLKFMPKKDLENSSYLSDDCLTIRCNIVVINEVADAADSLDNASVEEPDD